MDPSISLKNDCLPDVYVPIATGERFFPGRHNVASTSKEGVVPQSSNADYRINNLRAIIRRLGEYASPDLRTAVHELALQQRISRQSPKVSLRQNRAEAFANIEVLITQIEQKIPLCTQQLIASTVINESIIQQVFPGQSLKAFRFASLFLPRFLKETVATGKTQSIVVSAGDQMMGLLKVREYNGQIQIVARRLLGRGLQKDVYCVGVLAGPPIKEAQTPVFAYAKPGRDLSESRFQQNRDDLAAESSLLAGLHSKKIPHLMAMTPVYKRHKDAPVLKGTVMPFYECGTVRQYLQFHPNSVSAKERLAIAKDVAEALEGLHQLNVIHSDLKPENIFLVKTAQGFQTGFQAVVGDFGLSLDATQSFSGWQGTRAYMAPEMVDNLGKQWKPTPALDMWALGLFFVELFYETTRTNFLNMLDSKGDNRFEQLRNKVVSRVSGPTPLNKLIVDLLSMQPGDRPSAARVASILTFLLKN